MVVNESMGDDEGRTGTDLDPSRIDVGEYRITYYPRSGGVVISHRSGVVVDAGLIGTRGPISPERLARYAHYWHSWRIDWEQTASHPFYTNRRPY